MRKTNFDFYSKRKLFFTISVVMLVITLLCTVFMGVDLDIQYKGGTMITYSYEGDIDLGEFENVVSGVVNGAVNIQESNDIATGATNLVVSLASTNGITADEQAALTDAVEAAFSTNNIQTGSLGGENKST